MKKRVSTAAYLAGVTTLAVSLPMMASARSVDMDRYEDAPQKAGMEQALQSERKIEKSEA